MELHLVFSLLILFSNKNWSQGQDTCTVVNNINGCSTPLRLPFPYKSLFTPACNRHDVCYRCGVSHGWKQEECDKGFKQRMYTLCQNMTSSSLKNKRSTDESSWGKDFFVKMYNGWKKATENSTNTEQAKRLWNEALGIFKLVIKWRAIIDPVNKCEHGADIYYNAVKTFGVFAYRTTKKQNCKETCAKTMGNPHTKWNMLNSPPTTFLVRKT